MKTSGIIGTAKNTGKTTTLSAILKKEYGNKVAVTGIGYDGEEIDNITLLPKPRLFFDRGIIVATSEKCILQSEVGYKIISETDILTPLGKVLIVVITKPGLLVIAGPNKASELKILISILSSLNIQKLFVDGSLNRLSPMFLLDTLIFTTGGSRSTNIEQLVSEMQTAEKVFYYPKCTINIEKSSVITIFNQNDSYKLKMCSIFDEEDSESLLTELPDNFSKIYFPAFISAKGLEFLINNISNKGIEFIFHSPIQLLLSTEFEFLQNLINKFEASGNSISYIYKPVLEAITINPFYPILEGFNYSAGFIDKKLFFEKMSEKLRTPVYNVKEDFTL